MAPTPPAWQHKQPVPQERHAINGKAFCKHCSMPPQNYKRKTKPHIPFLRHNKAKSTKSIQKYIKNLLVELDS
jgi:hypothetical protein